jgi:methylated-DNA-protein-cysteine methyltransferase-like protein
MAEKYCLPWHRIIRADGSAALEGPSRDLQIALLRAEGIAVSKQGRVDLGIYGWQYGEELPSPAVICK